MSKNYTLKIITPDRKLFEGEVRKTLVTTNDGGIEIYQNHTSIAVITVPGKTEFQDESGNKRVLFTSNGIVTFNENTLTFCCDSGEWPEEIDLSRAEKARERAENRLKESSKFDERRAKLALIRAITRIDIKNNNI